MSLRKGREIAKKAIEAMASTQMVVLRLAKMYTTMGDLTAEDTNMDIFGRNHELRESFLKSGIPDMSHMNEPKDRESLEKIEHYTKEFLSLCSDIIEQNAVVGSVPFFKSVKNIKNIGSLCLVSRMRRDKL